MDLENKLYLVVGIPTVFFLFGFAIVLNLFPGDILAFILMVLICIGLSFSAILFISAEIEPVALDRKGIFIGICIFLILLDFTSIFLRIFFPGDVVSFLIGGALAILISLIIIYIAMRALNPLLETPIVEYVLGIVIALISGIILFTLVLDDIIGILLTVGLGLLTYIFLFLAIHFYRTSD